MRLKGRRPHDDWPVPYPYECPKDVKRCPTRAIDDTENYLIHLLTSTEPLVQSKAASLSTDATFMARHVHNHEPDPEDENDIPRTDPAVWVPPQARSKIHVYTTLFSNYMELVHPYEEPVEPHPLCAFKFNVSKFEDVCKAYTAFPDAIEYFGVFEYDKPLIARRLASCPEDFERKARYHTGNEVCVIIIRRISEDAFLSFASIEPYFVTERDEAAQAMIDEYFPEGAEDMILLSDDTSDSYEEMEEEEEAEDEEENEEVQDRQEETLQIYSFL